MSALIAIVVGIVLLAVLLSGYPQLAIFAIERSVGIVP